MRERLKTIWAIAYVLLPFMIYFWPRSIPPEHRESFVCLGCVWECFKPPEGETVTEERLPDGIHLEDGVYWATCPECGTDQEDMGCNVECDECGYGPMPFRS